MLILKVDQECDIPDLAPTTVLLDAILNPTPEAPDLQAGQSGGSVRLSPQS